jgi:hypothetical protein
LEKLEQVKQKKAPEGGVLNSLVGTGFYFGKRNAYAGF